MSPILHDLKCRGQLSAVELDGGEATLLSCSDCEFLSCSDVILVDYPEQMGEDRFGKDMTDGFRNYKNSNMDDLTYVWYPDVDSIQLDSLTDSDKLEHLIMDKPTSAVSQHIQPSCPITQHDQNTLTATEHTAERRNDYARYKNAKDFQATQRSNAESKLDVHANKAIEDLSHAEINELLEIVPCPECQSTNIEVIDEGGLLDELNVRWCKDCKACFGADDSMDVEDLQRLLEEKKVIFKPNKQCRCGNDDVEKFVLRELDEATGQPLIECQRCFHQTTLEIFQADEQGLVEDDCWILADSLSEDNQTIATSYNSGIGFEPVPPEKGSIIQDQPSFHCDNCNNNEEAVFEKLRDVHGRVVSIKCLNCDSVRNVLPPIVCPVCRSKDFETCYDNEGRLIYAACRNCLNHLDLQRKSSSAGNDILTSSEAEPRWAKRKPIRKRIFSLNDVSIGDHVAFHKDYVIWHHAIVVSMLLRDQKLTVVHYTGGLKKHQGHFASVREEELKLDFDKEEIYVYDYGKDCYPPPDVVARARSRVGEHRYNLLVRNCEHFAYWCKAGREQSSQVKAFCRRLWKACGSAVGTGVREGVVTACRGLVEGIPAKQIFRVGFHGGVDRVQGVAGSAGLAAGLKGGAVVFDVFLNLALEVGIFAYCAHKSMQKLKSGEISKNEFNREVFQVGCECVGGLLGATGGGFLGQLAIPVPFLGSLVGCTLGTLIGRFLGSIVGKQIADRFFDPK